jgi:hypothetical protein
MTDSDWKILRRFGVTPDNLTVGGELDLSHTQITALPDGLTVGGRLGLSGTKITALPDGLTVGGWLGLSGTKITALPDGLTVGGLLDLSHTQITALPDGLTVGGLLDLRGTQITALLNDPRGYRLDRVGDHYHAGCRKFTASEALAHWGSPSYPDRARGDAYVAAVKAEEARRKNQHE